MEPLRDEPIDGLDVDVDVKMPSVCSLFANERPVSPSAALAIPLFKIDNRQHPGDVAGGGLLYRHHRSLP